MKKIMKKVMILSVLLLLFLSAPGSIFCLAQENTTKEAHSLSLARLVHIKGTIEYKVNEEAERWKEAQPAMELQPENILKTRVNSHGLIMFFDGSTIRIGESTIVTVRELSAQLNEQGEIDEAQVNISILLGDLTAKIEKVQMKERKFEIETPSSLMGVRGTFFTVEVDRAKKTTVKVLRGKVSVRNLRLKETQPVKEVIVEDGQKTNVGLGRTPAETQNLSPREIAGLKKVEEQITKEAEESVFLW